MAGHSKWAQIKRAKGANDVARGKLFTKLGREILVAAKLGGPDPAANPRLATAIRKAREANMPNDNIHARIKQATGDKTNNRFESITYEGYAIGGIAVIVLALTDNKNRTAGEVRHAFDKFGGSLGVTGATNHIFVEIEGEYIPEYEITLSPEHEIKFEKFLDLLDNNDDVQEVHHNAG